MNEELLKIIRCPVCLKGNILEIDDSLKCGDCQTIFKKTQKIPVLLENKDLKSDYSKLLVNKNSGFWLKKASWDSQFSNSVPKGTGYCLDLGCGGGQRDFIENLGYRYIGIDYSIDYGVDIIATLKKLPIKDGSVNLVTSRAVFEHLPDPWKSCREIFRVLKSGGCFVGTAAFLQPFHDRSYFHMTHLGVHKLLEESGFIVLSIQPFDESGLESILSTMLENKRIVKFIVRIFEKIIMGIRSIGIKYYKYLNKNNSEKEKRINQFKGEEKFRFTSGILFIAKKP